MSALPLSNVAEFTVSELSAAIKRTVEEAYGFVRLRGEVSGYRGPHSSGHVYLSLKDERSKIDAVIWKGVFSGLKFKPEEGLEVIVTGRVTTFPGKSGYQIIIEQLEPAGAGALMALLEERKKRFAAEGLFDAARKRPLPFWPAVVGIVTSPTGAVIRDMLHGFEERCPTHVIVWPVRVQGEACAAEVAAAIHGFNRIDANGPFPRPDLLIVARGGGSLEDLWGFNEEAVVRAAAESAIPLISAVGHETDWTLIDLVADARAPTPTKAAEWAVPKHADLVMKLADLLDRSRRCIRRHLEKIRAEFKSAERGMPKPASLLAVPRQRLDTAAQSLSHSLRHFTQQARARFERFSVRLSPWLAKQAFEKATDRFSRGSQALQTAFARGVQGRKSRAADISARLDPSVFQPIFIRQHTRLDSAEGRLIRSLHHFSQQARARLDKVGVRLAPRTVSQPISRVRQHLDRHKDALLRQFLRGVGLKRAAFQTKAERLNGRVFQGPLQRRGLTLSSLSARMDHIARADLARKRGQLDGLSAVLRSLSHKSVLDRGFALVRDGEGRMVPRAQVLAGQILASTGALLEIEFADGRIAAQTLHSDAAEVLSSAPMRAAVSQPRKPGSSKKDDDAQGTLL